MQWLRPGIRTPSWVADLPTLSALVCPRLFIFIPFQIGKAARSRKDQNVKLGSLDECATKSYHFMKDLITVGLSFNLVRLKCKFFRVTDPERHKVCDRFRELVAADLFSVLVAYEATAPGQNKADSWVRALLLGYLANEINDMAPERVDEYRLVWGRSCGALVSMLRDKSVESILAGIALDIHMLEIVCMAGSLGGPRYSQMATAEQHIKGSSRLAVLHQALQSEAGTELMMPLNQMNIMTANDEIGDKRFEVASQAVLDSAMLHVALCTQPGSSVYLLRNADLVLTAPMMLEPLLVDTMAHITESVKLWSAARLEAREDELAKWVFDLGQVLCAGEFALALQAISAIQPAVEQMNVVVDIDEGVGELATASFAMCAGLKSAPFVTTASFYDKVENLANCFKGSEPAAAALKSIVNSGRRNFKLRECINEVLQLMVSMATFGLPSTPGEAIDQWRGKGDASCLAIAIDVVQKVETLGSLGSFDFKGMARGCGKDAGLDMEALVVKGFDRQTGEETNMKVGDLVKFGELICGLPVVAYAQQLTNAGASHMLSAFGQLTEMNGLVLGVKRAQGDKTLMSIASAFVAIDLMAGSVSGVGKALASEGDICLESSSAFELIEELVEVCNLPTVLVPDSIAIAVKPVPMKSDWVLAVCQVHVHVHHVAAGLAWVATSCSPPGACTTHNQLRKDLGAVLNMIDTHLSSGAKAVEGHRALWPIQVASSLRHSIDTLGAWLQDVRGSFKDLCEVVLGSLVASMSEVSRIVKSQTPSFEHYLDDSKCNVKLVRSKLLNLPNKELLTQESVRLFKILAEIGRFKTAYGLEAACDDVHQEALSEGSTAFKHAKRVMAIVAAATAAFAMTGASQVAECERFLAKPGDLPQALIKELGIAIAPKRGSQAGAQASRAK